MFGIDSSYIGGVRVAKSAYVPTTREQFRFPKSKKRRIRRKWSKNPANIREFEKCFRMNGVLIVGPRTWEAFIRRKRDN